MGSVQVREEMQGTEVDEWCIEMAYIMAIEQVPEITWRTSLLEKVSRR